MQQISLDSVANQNVIVYLENERYSITLKESFSQGMLCSISRNDVELVSNVICVFGTPVLPYPYLEKGNFVFLTINDDLPNWRLFGTEHYLFFMSFSEIEDLRNAR